MASSLSVPEGVVSLGTRSAAQAGIIGSNTQPWIALAAVKDIYEHLPHARRILEYGGGSSTTWLLHHAPHAEVTTVEHDDTWLKLLRSSVAAHPAWAKRWRCLQVPNQAAGKCRGADGRFYDNYVCAGEKHAPFDMIIVDGRARSDCARQALKMLRPGGMLVLDDAERKRYHAAMADVPASWWRRVHETPYKHTAVYRRPAATNAK